MGLEHVLVAGGGSGGHVFPALAVVHELAERGCRVSWLGRVEGMEKGLVEGHGIPYHGLPAAAVIGRGLPQKVAALSRTAASAISARRLIRREEVQAVLGTGAAVACLPGARDLRCRVEPTGVPVRAAFDRGYEPPDQAGSLRLLVLGGSQGARQLNHQVPKALAMVKGRYPDLQVTHQVGEAHLEEARQAYSAPDLQGLAVEIVPFLTDMARAISRAHLVISRAGAITLAEICARGRAALLLPLGLAGGHQVANARRMVSTGGARMLSGAEIGAEDVARVLGELLDRPDHLVQMGAAGHILYRREAPSDIARLLAEVAGEV